MSEKAKTRGERRMEILARIEALRAPDYGGHRDAVAYEMELRALGLERDLIDSWQIADHFRHRLEKVRQFLVDKVEEDIGGLVDDASSARAFVCDEVDVDLRPNEPGLPLPTCPHCGKGLIP